MSRKNDAEVWVKELKNGSKAIGLFNRGSEPNAVRVTWDEADLVGKKSVRDLWRHKDLGNFENEFSLMVPAHGAILLCIAK